VSEVFESIQGEGKFTGHPALFIRLYGCSRVCSFCDTMYSVRGGKYTAMSVEEVADAVRRSNQGLVVWTGGEPLLQRDLIVGVVGLTRDKQHHLETNGDLLQDVDFSIFDYLAISPKTLETADRVVQLLRKYPRDKYDVKVVTDLRVNLDLIPFATTLQPLTTGDRERDLQVMRNVWAYCVANGKRFSPRIHYLVFGLERGV